MKPRGAEIGLASAGNGSANTTSYQSIKAMKLPILILAAVVAVPTVYSQIFYTTDFTGAVGGEWSNTTKSTTPVGARDFLGEFGNTTVALNLNGLPSHGAVTVSFDLFVIRSWDGNNSGTGPDHWSISVGDSGSQSVVLDATFANVVGAQQSYPDSSPSNHPAHTGAAEVNTLGYFTAFGNPVDSIYNLSFTIPHTATAFRAVFGSQNVSDGLLDETWGIDNVQVSVSAVPEPGEYAAAFGLGLAGFALWRRRSRKPASTVQAA